jgi:hypothetical protein
MSLIKEINAPKVNESLLYGTDYKPFTVGAFYSWVMKEIKLNNGMVAMVDDADYEWLNQWKWRALKGRSTYYACRGGGCGGHVYMHRLIMDAPKGMDVDHMDSNGLNNQRGNMRVCTRSQNIQNSRKLRKTRSPYKGVACVIRNYFTSQITHNGKVHFLGYFNTDEEAARSYDMAALELYGEQARINFKESLLLYKERFNQN